MAKDYKRGADYKLYLNTSVYATPTWVEIKAVGDVSADPNSDDIEVPERGSDTGHMHGEKNPAFTFTLFEDAGNANVETIVASLYSGAMLHLAVANGPIATVGTKYLHMECCSRAPLGANRADPASYDVTANKHANSDNNLVRATVSA